MEADRCDIGSDEELQKAAAERLKTTTSPSSSISSGVMSEQKATATDREQETLAVPDNDLEQRAQREIANWKCGFLRLSPELRNRIYQDTIPTTTRISVVSRLAKTEINLLQVCRAIRSETVPIFYGNTTFTFDLRTRPNFTKAKSWLDGLSPTAVASLRKIYVQSDLNCCCKGAERGKNDKSTSVFVWVDVENGVWTQYGYHGCRHCHGSGQEGAKEIAWRIANSVAKQDVQKQDLVELLDIMRPIKAFDFSFEMAKDGEGQATFETRPKAFGVVGSSSKASPRLAGGRTIKQPRTRHRPGMRLSDVAALSLEDGKVFPDAENTGLKAQVGLLPDSPWVISTACHDGE